MEPRHALDRAAWLWHPELAIGVPGFVLFRLNVKLARAETVRLQVSADICYALALDGALVGRGPDTGDVTHWSFATYELKLKAGVHQLEALVWWAKTPQSPDGRMSWRGGFACAGLGRAGKRFTTGVASWRAARLEGMVWGPAINRSYHVIGGSAQVDLAKFDMRGVRWMQPAVVRVPVDFNVCGIVARGWQLLPSALPEQRHDLWRGGRVRAQLPRWTRAQGIRFGAETTVVDAADWNQLLQSSGSLTLPARYQATVLIDTDDYLCGYAMLEFSGGAGTQVRIEWAESLFDREDRTVYNNTPGPKGNRGEVAGKLFFVLATRGNSVDVDVAGPLRRGGARGVTYW